MSVEIYLPPFLQALAGGASKFDVAGGTIGECLRDLVRLCPQLKDRIFNRRGKLIKGINIFVNRANVSPDPLSRLVCNGDKVHVASTVLGG
jgi:molybdopterin converting factor small subunit